MKFNENLAAIHAYLCADGYVIRNPIKQKHKYYHIGLRNTNNILLRDFKRKIKNEFGISAYIINDGRCRFQSKEIFYFLTKDFSYYSNEWILPKVSKNNLRFWLRAYFDCDGWVELQKAKNRSIRLDSINQAGLNQIKKELEKFSIESTIKKRRQNIWRLSICGKDDILKFQKQINFLHPEKRKKLNEAINSYRTYDWKIPKNKKDLLDFVKSNGKLRKERNETRFFSIKKSNLVKLKKALNKFNINTKIQGPWKNNTGSSYYILRLKRGEKVGSTKRNKTS